MKRIRASGRQITGMSAASMPFLMFEKKIFSASLPDVYYPCVYTLAFVCDINFRRDRQIVIIDFSCIDLVLRGSYEAGDDAVDTFTVLDPEEAAPLWHDGQLMAVCYARKTPGKPPLEAYSDVPYSAVAGVEEFFRSFKPRSL